MISSGGQEASVQTKPVATVHSLQSPFPNPWSRCPTLVMATHAQLSHAKSIAKAHYEVRIRETEARARPPGGQNENKRLLEKVMKKVNEARRNYYKAAHTFVNRGTFAEAPEQAAATDLVTQESLARED